MELSEKIKELRRETNLNRTQFAEHFGIPLRTVEEWEAGRRKPPEYIPRMLKYQILYEKMNNVVEKEEEKTEERHEVLIKTDDEGNKMVVIPQILFKGKRTISWDKVENYLVKYINDIFKVAETNDFLYIGQDFADEFCGSEYTRKLRGALPKTKANMAQGIREMVEIATDKRWTEDFGKKHGNKAKNGWYRYNTCFALPVLNETGEIRDYNIYQAVLIVRCASDQQLYLYDIQNIKKK